MTFLGEDFPNPASNPRLAHLRREVDQRVLKPLRSHGWNASVEREVDHGSFIEISASKEAEVTRIAVLYSSSEIDNTQYLTLAERVDHIFFNGQPYKLDAFTRNVTIPVEPLESFFPFLVQLNKRVDPDRSPRQLPHKPSGIRRLTSENPLDSVTARLRQFTSVRLARKLVERRGAAQGASLSPDIAESKATGIAYSMRSALEYLSGDRSDRLNKRILGLYYAVMAFAQAEMLAAPDGPRDLDEVEGMTKQGHGLFTLSGQNGGFADLHVGVLATGFLPQWLSFLSYDTSGFPPRKPKAASDLEKIPASMACTLRDLFASMPEVDDLFREVFGGPNRWIEVAYDSSTNFGSHGPRSKADSTYGLFIDRSGEVSPEVLAAAGWPVSELQLIKDVEDAGFVYRGRVDHIGHKVWWNVLPTHSSPFGNQTFMLLPTLGGMRHYRTIAAATLYALSIMVRYMPSAWRRIEGGDEDHYLAIVTEALAVWERILPEQFLASIADEAVHTAQPGSWFS
ncbi:YaaC family protein [Rhizobium johnstonii]|uniref:YaaC family protein n=1 Tax=Rhizobium johnstonii TaxID=3019933 RepID=UPI003F9D9FAD